MSSLIHWLPFFRFWNFFFFSLLKNKRMIYSRILRNFATFILSLIVKSEQTYFTVQWWHLFTILLKKIFILWFSRMNAQKSRNCACTMYTVDAQWSSAWNKINNVKMNVHSLPRSGNNKKGEKAYTGQVSFKLSVSRVDCLNRLIILDFTAPTVN